MKLRGIRIKNFKSIRDLSLAFPESGILVLVGENNAGKSNIIRSIDMICGESWYGREKLEERDYYLKNTQNSIEVELYFEDSTEKRCAIFSSQEKWPVYYRGWQDKTKIYGSIKEDFPCTYLGADRTLDKHLSFYDWTLIGRIRKAFHKKIQPDLKTELDQQYEALIQIFSQVPGFDDFKSDFSTFFDELYPHSKSRLNIDFKPFTPANYFKTMQILAQDPIDEGSQLDVEELGEGSRNLILISLLRSYAKNFKGTGDLSGILALEEPELFLHPQARRHLHHVLREIADSGIQIIISTHSASFIDTEFFDDIGRVTKVRNNDDKEETNVVLCKKQDLVNHCISTGVPEEKVNKDNIVEYYKTTSNARLNEGFFARCLILVEGETEELAIPEYLMNYCKSCDAMGISIIAVNGKNQIPKYWRLYSKFEIPIIIVFDNDNGTGKEKSNQNIATCFGLEIDDILNVPQYSKVVNSNTTPQTQLLILDTDFETCIQKELRQDELYREINEQARKLIKPIGKQQKGVIARYVCRKLKEKRPDFTPKLIRDLVTMLDDFLPVSSTNIQSNILDDDLPF
ncbi:MAG: ATP-dependent endonuclease [Cyclobacteriaceae bacterium]